MNLDPIDRIEKLVKEIHDRAKDYAKPVFRRYPLTFAFLLTFGVAAIVHGIELMSDEIPFFHDNPSTLIVTGVIILLFSGTLYKKLEKN